MKQMLQTDAASLASLLEGYERARQVAIACFCLWLWDWLIRIDVEVRIQDTSSATCLLL
jgi:hypothetical protein